MRLSFSLSTVKTYSCVLYFLLSSMKTYPSVCLYCYQKQNMHNIHASVFLVISNENIFMRLSYSLSTMKTYSCVCLSRYQRWKHIHASVFLDINDENILTRIFIKKEWHGLVLVLTCIYLTSVFFLVRGSKLGRYSSIRSEIYTSSAAWNLR